MAKATPSFRYGGLILLQYLIWGLGNPVTKLSLTGIPPFYGLAIRFGLAFILFVLFFRRRAFAGLTRENLADCLMACLPLAVVFILATWALYLTTATNAGFLLSISVLFIPLFRLLVLRTKLDWRILPLIALAIAGVYLLWSRNVSFVFRWGESIALLCALVYAATFVNREKQAQNLNTIALATLQAGVTALLTFLCALFLEDGGALGQAAASAWGALAYLAVGCAFIAYLIQNLALRHVCERFAALTYAALPLFTAIFSYFLLGEQLNARGMLGGGLILLGLVLAGLLQTKSQPLAAEHGN